MMARYAQMHTDDGLAVLKAGLTKEFVLALTFVAQHEDVAIPIREYEKAVQKLAAIGVEISLQRAIGKTLSDNARSKRYYEKTQDKRKNSHVRTNVKSSMKPNEDLLHSPSPTSSPSEKIKAPAVPRYVLSKAQCLKAWNDAISEATGTPSCVAGIGSATRAQAFHRVVYGNGETFVDVVRRRRQLKASLNLHWTANDYANDLARVAPAKAQTQEEWFASVGIPHHSQVRR